MEIISFPAASNGITIPDAGKRPLTDPPIEFGLNNMQLTVCFAKVPDPANIVIGTGTDVAAIGATASLDMNSQNVSPIKWENAPLNKLKFRLTALVTGPCALDLPTLLSTYNVLVFNKSIASTPYGGFLVLTIGDASSSADLKLTARCLQNGQFTALINKLSKEF